MLRGVRNVKEVAGHVQIGAQLLGRADAGPEVEDGSGAPEVPHPLFRQKSDGTLLAVVPIPGTGTSMAIVGYPVTAPGSISALPAADAPERSAGGRMGLLLDHDQ